VKKQLSPRQRLFVLEYLKDLNATQAAIRAGYSKRTAEQLGYRLLRNVQIKTAIARAQKKRAQRLEISADRVLQEVASLAYAKLEDCLEQDPKTRVLCLKPFEQMPEEARRALESVELIDGKLKVKMHSKPTALDHLMKHLGLYEKDNSQLFPKDVTFRFVYAGEKGQE